MNIIIDGNSIKNEDDFHNIMMKEFDFGQYYGRNLHALWDYLTTDVERPIKIIWNNYSESEKNLGSTANDIKQLFERVRQQDIEYGLKNIFDYELK